MLVEIRVTKGRRVRHPSSHRVLMNEQTHRVEWGPAWERLCRCGDIERLDSGTVAKPALLARKATTPEVNE